MKNVVRDIIMLSVFTSLESPVSDASEKHSIDYELKVHHSLIFFSF